MKITLVISTLNPGGAERVMSVLANAWAEQQQKVNLITFQNASAKPFYALHPNIKLSPLNLLKEGPKNFLGKSLNLFKRIRVLRRSFKTQKPDLIISFMDTVNITSLLAGLGLGVPIIISERIDPHSFDIGFLNSLLRRIIYPLAAHLVVQTTRILNYFPKALHPRISIIPNPVSMPPIIYKQQKINFEQKSIIAVGRLVQQKGFDLLLHAFAEVRQKFPEWKLNIVGEGEKRSELEMLSVQLNLQTHVSFPGIQHDIYSEFYKNSLFVLSSRFEGFPNALCEAMAIGLPVIAFDCGSGPNDIVRPDIDGLLIPAQNIIALSGAMEKLMVNSELRAQFGNRASEITTRFSLDAVMHQWNTLIKNFIRT